VRAFAGRNSMAKVDIARAMPQVRLMVRNREIGRDARDLYEVLLAWQRPDGTTQATLAALKRALEIGSDQLQRAVYRLIEAGRITKHRTRVWSEKLRRWVNGPNVYTLLPLLSGSQSRAGTTEVQAEATKKLQAMNKKRKGSIYRLIHRIIQGLSPELSPARGDVLNN
jgi:hypothetical protein